ncbi:hypothetical protein [Leptospira sp. GIMC2001]|uniref:hypothetical protein n=1 Tax=Leptospira sp. GIMC2001 TaxID=1513297 RepID=UPI00234BE6C2|nr:hypothetical protein [Leptospira sp. GIMC2001]WCL51044.1 hypothetical protein O4O04_09590 [Leptospira sp. GIMC2001]
MTKYIYFFLFFLLFSCKPNDNTENEDITNILLLQQLANGASASSNSASTDRTFTSLTLGTQVTSTTKRGSPAYFRFSTGTGSTYYFGGFGKSNSGVINIKLFNSPTVLDASTQISSISSSSSFSDGTASSISLDANKEYAFEVSTENFSDISFQFVVLKDHVSGKGSCKFSINTQCIDFPTGSTISSCPLGYTDYNASSCAARFAAKTIVGKCTWLFAEGANTAYTQTYYDDSTYSTTGAAQTNCLSAAKAKFFTSN